LKPIFLFFRFIRFFCLLFFFTFCLVPASTYSQRNNFQHYSLKEGLPQSTIYCITQDQRGYLWFGTDGEGLCRFDGLNFKTFNKKNGFKGSTVRSILLDSKGRIWAGTKDNGIIVYDGIKFQNIGRPSGLNGSTVLSLLEDKDGTIWAGTDDAGLNKIIQVSRDSFRVKTIDQSKGLSSNSIFDIHQDKDGHLWLATFEGINVITLIRDTFQINILRGKNEIPSNEILSIAEDHRGALWFGTLEEGVFKIEPPQKKESDHLNFQLELLSRKISYYYQGNGFAAKKTWNILVSRENELWFASVENGIVRQRLASTSRNPISPKYTFDHYTDKEGLPGNQILSLFEDNKGNIWIGTSGDGLCKFMGDRFSHYTERDGLSSNKVQGIDQDTSGNYWIATNGGGLVKFQLEKEEPLFTSYTTQNGLLGNTILSVSSGKTANNANVWAVVSDNGITKFDGKKFTNYTHNIQGLLNNSAYSILVDDKGIVWCGTKDGISRYDGIKFIQKTMEEMNFTEKDVNAIIQDKKGVLWFGTSGGLVQYGGDGNITTYDEAEGLFHKKIVSLVEGIHGNIWIGTSNGGLYMLDRQMKEKVKIRNVANDSLLSSNSIRSIIFQDKNNLIVGTDKGFNKILLDENEKIINVMNYDASDGFLGVECNDNALYKDHKGNIWFGTMNGLTRYNPSVEKINRTPPQVHITGIKLFYKDVDWSAKADSVMPWFSLPYELKLPYYENHLTFYYSAISLDNPQKIRFRYQLEGLEKDWSPPTTQTEHDYSALPPGTYTFKVMAAGANGIWSEPTAFSSFKIAPPWYKTIWFYAICVIVLFVIIYSYIKGRERHLIKEKEILEDKVIERTAEVVKQKEEVVKQKDIVEHKNKEITDSINYAKKIQEAILPTTKFIKELAPDSFVFFQPKDIVSGDFYWFSRKDEKILFAAADCTGHGVPGALMSMIGSNLLSEIVNDKNISEPATILNHLHIGVRKSLKQDSFDTQSRDGMDIALCSFDSKKSILEYAGANRSLYLVKNKTLEIIKANKVPIGGLQAEGEERRFKNHSFQVNADDMVYLCSDGYADQFGGLGGKKFMEKNFKEMLLKTFMMPIEQQKELFKQTINSWKGDFEQIDDILVIGVRL